MKRLKSYVIIAVLLAILSIAIFPAFAQDNAEVLTVYSGRNEALIGPLLEKFTTETGVQVNVIYAGTSALANQILEEGENSPADVFFAQDAGALGALAGAGVLAPLPIDVLERVSDARFVSSDRLWVGVSARARVLVYNPTLLAEKGLELPASILDLTSEQWRGLVGWAPTNASLQANVTAMRVLLGDDAARTWLEDLVANDVQPYENNGSVVQAVANGEIVVGLVNHYYLYAARTETPDMVAENYYFPAGDPGALVNIAGIGVLTTSDQPGLAQRFVLYLLSKDAQTYFANQTFEYPLVDGVALSVELKPLVEIEAPNIDLSDLADLEGSLRLIEESGALD